MQIYRFLKWILLDQWFPGFRKLSRWNKTFLIGFIFFGISIIIAILGGLFSLGLGLKPLLFGYILLFMTILVSLVMAFVEWIGAQYKKFQYEQEAEASEIVRRLRDKH
jgi:hypothetical protein